MLSPIDPGGRRRRHHLLPALWPLLLTACSPGLPPRPADRADNEIIDQAPAAPINLALIKEPVPRWEPRSAYGNAEEYIVNGQSYRVLASARGYRERGIASWYGTKFHGRRTSSGEVYSMYEYTAAHKTLPLPTYARVTNLQNRQSIIVKINDRGPFHDNRLIDLSYAAAVRLGVDRNGTAPVEIQAIDPENPRPAESPQIQALPASAPLLYLQAGAFSVVENARRLRERLQKAGFDRAQIRPPRPGSGEFFRVMIGPIETVEKTDSYISQLQAMGITDARVIID